MMHARLGDAAWNDLVSHANEHQGQASGAVRDVVVPVRSWLLRSIRIAKRRRDVDLSEGCDRRRGVWYV